MVKTIYEYYCDCCEKRVESKDDLRWLSLKMEDEQCKTERTAGGMSYVVSRFYIGNGGDRKYFCEECYQKYRKTIDEFVKALAELGIKQNKAYTGEKEDDEEEDDLL